MTIRIGAAIAAIGICGLAAAQVGGNNTDTSLVNTSGVSVKIGIGIPFDRSLSDGIGRTLTGFGIEYQPLRSLLRNSETYFAADIFVRDYSGSRGYGLPITINQRFYNSQTLSTERRRQYAFIGAGFSVVDLNGGGTNTDFTIRGGVGAELGERVFFEFAAYFGDARGNARPNVFGIFGGYRF